MPAFMQPAGLRGLQGRHGPARPAMRYFAYCRKSSEAEDRQVMSIESQRTELTRLFAGIEVIEIVEEAQSAKSPGRPLFSNLIARIEAGEADGLIAWAPDRLARNSVDGGRIIHLIDTGVIRDLKFATYTFENNAQGKFMLSIMFGQSKYYSDALSENVKRGNRTKAEKGWRPGAAPIGYVNDLATKTIVVDPVYFPLVRRMFDLVLTGGCSAKEVARIARDEWHLRTPKRRKGGGIVHPSMVHRLLTNPFYAGLFLWEGKLVTGSHEPVVTLDEFRAVEAAIRRPNRSRPSAHEFTFSGLIRCGECGYAVSAQETVNRFGSRYVYYRCTRKSLTQRCQQPAIREEELERQILAWLDHLPNGSEAERKIRAALDGMASRAMAAGGAVRKSIERALADARSQLAELTTLRLRSLVDDAEFMRTRAQLQAEVVRLTQRLDQLAQPNGWIKPLTDAIPLSIQAAEWFRRADRGLKRAIVRAVGSNLTLSDQKLSIEAAKWLFWMLELWRCPIRLGLRDEVQTLEAELKRFADTMTSDSTQQEQFDLARQVASRFSRQANEGQGRKAA